MSPGEDQADVEKVLAGNPAGFEGIVRRWQGPLVNLAYRFCHDRGRAEEMAQEAFLRAYRGLAGWRRQSAFSTWLFALATNLYCSEMRRLPVNSVSLDIVDLKGSTTSRWRTRRRRSGSRSSARGLRSSVKISRNSDPFLFS